MNIFKTYYFLTKPGIIMGNLIATIGGYALGASGNLNLITFISLLFGTSLIIASACVFNNYLDRNIDAKMNRTKKRALVTGEIPVINAIVFASILGFLGLLILIVYTNLLTAVVGLIGFLFYVFIYTFSKRITVHGTLIGSISGAVPPVAGYTAATNSFNEAAVLLFLILVCWQMPHFYAISIYRINDYKNANIPVLPIIKGLQKTKIQMLIYIIAFIITSILLTIFNHTGFIYLLATLLLGIIWLKKAVEGFKTNDNTTWAKSMFKISIAILMTLCILWSLEVVLP